MAAINTTKDYFAAVARFANAVDFDPSELIRIQQETGSIGLDNLKCCIRLEMEKRWPEMENGRYWTVSHMLVGTLDYYTTTLCQELVNQLPTSLAKCLVNTLTPRVLELRDAYVRGASAEQQVINLIGIGALVAAVAGSTDVKATITSLIEAQIPHMPVAAAVSTDAPATETVAESTAVAEPEVMTEVAIDDLHNFAADEMTDAEIATLISIQEGDGLASEADVAALLDNLGDKIVANLNEAAVLDVEDLVNEADDDTDDETDFDDDESDDEILGDVAAPIEAVVEFVPANLNVTKVDIVNTATLTAGDFNLAISQEDDTARLEGMIVNSTGKFTVGLLADGRVTAFTIVVRPK
jgi:hypothetical protein